MRRALLLLALAPLPACAETPKRAPPRPPVEIAALAPPEAPPPDLSSLERRLAEADAKLTTYRGRSSWPSPGDQEKWVRELDGAEARRRAVLEVWPPSAQSAAEAERRLADLEGRLSLLTAADGVFRFGERARNPVR